MTQFDYNSILTRIENSLRSSSSWADILVSGVNANLITAIAQEMAYQMTGQEYYTNENWWAKAQNKSSLLVESPVHGYVVPRKIGATGTLYISMDPNLSNIITNPSYIPTGATTNVPLPQYFQFSNGSTYVCLNSATTLTTGTPYLSVLVTEGKHQTVNWLSQGLPWETKVINEASLENFQFQLYVNGVLWTQVNSLYTASSTDMVYEINYDPSLTFFTLRFGNGVFGQQLGSNATMEFDYISTDGINGNITALNNITTVVDQAYSSSGVPVTLYVTNPSAIVGGSDYPSIEQIRNTSPNVYQAGNRASSISDYQTILLQQPTVGKALVWGGVEYNLDHGYPPMQYISLEQNLVHLALLGPGPTYNLLDITTQNNLVTTLHAITDPTDLLSFETPVKIYINFIVNAYVKNSSYSLATVQGAIDTTLQNTYGIANMSFGEGLYNSDVISIIDAVPGVKYHDTTIELIQFLPFGTPFSVVFSLPAVSTAEQIVPSSLKFYVNSVANPTTWSLVATVNSNGTFIAGIGYTINSNSQVNFATGVGTIIINSGISDPYTSVELKIVYQSTSSDLTTTARSQIFQYYSAQYTMNYAIN